jgi:hypothetical protein
LQLHQGFGVIVAYPSCDLFSLMNWRKYNIETMAQEIEFSVHLTEKDIARASDESTFRWRRWLLPGVVVSLTGIIGGVLEPEWTGLGFGVAAAGLTLIAWGAFMPALLRRKVVRYFLGTPLAQGKVHYQISDDQVRVTSALARSELSWSAFLKVQEMPSYLNLITGPLSGYLIPLAALQASQALELRELLKNRIQVPPVGGRV